MLSFASDYIAGAHPEILRRLMETNLEPLPGYGSDPKCRRAAEKILSACPNQEPNSTYLEGSTQTNQVVIDTLLRPWEGVLSAGTGHVSVHEAGAIEFSGHKVLTLPQENGKLRSEDVEAFCAAFYADENHEHMVFPGMVYLSFPTEYGTLYTKSELSAIAEVCRKRNLRLYLDGARLGYGLMSPANDLTLPEIAALCDAFYLGGTKVGALCGEAVVFPRGNAPAHFLTQMKQHGALLAKGRLLGVQFDALFTDDLYFQISAHAIAMAEELKALFREKGYPFLLDSPTNQQFIILEKAKMAELQEHVSFSFWENLDETHAAVRFATSWSTTEEDIQSLRALL